MSSSSTQSMMGGEAMEMKTTLVSTSEIEVKEVLKDGYLLGVTTKSMKMNFDGFGQKMSYDSENKTEKKEGPLASLDELINKTEELTVDFKGKFIEDASKNEDATKETKGERGGRGEKGEKG